MMLLHFIQFLFYKCIYIVIAIIIYNSASFYGHKTFVSITT